jgi:mono/diheme cytochrome c family protein
MNSIHRQLSIWSIAASALALAGCGQAPAPQFQLNQVLLVTNETSPSYQQEIANVLAAMFGTPDEPFAMPETGLDQQQLTLAAGAAWSDEGGVEHGLYRKHCVHCHGISGDGRGPTARFLNPYPRDYRQGKFKFKSTVLNAKPTDADLHRVMHNGVPGTAMPSFALLPRNQVDALVEYVKYLSIRGEMEQALIQFVYDELGEEEVEAEDGTVTIERTPLDPAADAEQAEMIKELLAGILTSWEEAADQVIEPAEDNLPGDDRTPEELAASIARGRELFFTEKGNCFSCHGPTALGDGQQSDFDVWS